MGKPGCESRLLTWNSGSSVLPRCLPVTSKPSSLRGSGELIPDPEVRLRTYTQSITKPQGDQLRQRWAKSLHPYVDEDSWVLEIGQEHPASWLLEWSSHPSAHAGWDGLYAPQIHSLLFWVPSVKLYMLVCSGCGWFKQKKCILSVLEAGSTGSRCQWGWFLLWSLSWSCKQLPSCCLLPSLSLCIHTPLVSLCGSNFFFL